MELRVRCSIGGLAAAVYGCGNVRGQGRSQATVRLREHARRGSILAGQRQIDRISYGGRAEQRAEQAKAEIGIGGDLHAVELFALTKNYDVIAATLYIHRSGGHELIVRIEQ